MYLVFLDEVTCHWRLYFFERGRLSRTRCLPSRTTALKPSADPPRVHLHSVRGTLLEGTRKCPQTPPEVDRIRVQHKLIPLASSGGARKNRVGSPHSARKVVKAVCDCGGTNSSHKWLRSSRPSAVRRAKKVNEGRASWRPVSAYEGEDRGRAAAVWTKRGLARFHEVGLSAAGKYLCRQRAAGFVMRFRRGAASRTA